MDTPLWFFDSRVIPVKHIITRYECQRIDTASLRRVIMGKIGEDTMTSRERVLKALRRQVPDRVPFSMGLCPSQIDELERRHGTRSPRDVFNMDVSGVSPLPVKDIPDVSKYVDEIPEDARIDDWGVIWTQSGFYHFLGMVHTLKNVTTVKEIEEYPFPDLAADYRFEGFAEKVQALKDNNEAVVAHVSPLGGTILWPAYKLRGMEQLLMDMVVEPELATVLYDKVTRICADLATKLAQYDLDIIWLADDFGTQKGLLCSIDMWREWFKGRLKEVVDAAKSKNPDVLVALHSDGAVQDIIPDLIDIGIDVLNPVQPECMDPVEIKREYGNDIAFWGTIGTQTTLPFGTPEEVRETTKLMIQEVGKGGGLLLAPTHVVEPEVPWENIVAMYEAVEKYGAYT